MLKCKIHEKPQRLMLKTPPLPFQYYMQGGELDFIVPKRAVSSTCCSSPPGDSELEIQGKIEEREYMLQEVNDDKS